MWWWKEMVIPSRSSHFSIASLIDATNLLIVFHASKHCFFHLDDLSCALHNRRVDHLAVQRDDALALLFGDADGLHDLVRVVDLRLGWAEDLVDALHVPRRDGSLAGEA